MSDYTMHIKGDIGLSEYSNIHDYLGVVNKNDSFSVILEIQDSNEINMLSSLLRDNGFYVSEEGYDNLGRYHINAYKI